MYMVPVLPCVLLQTRHVCLCNELFVVVFLILAGDKFASMWMALATTFEDFLFSKRYSDSFYSMSPYNYIFDTFYTGFSTIRFFLDDQNF